MATVIMRWMREPLLHFTVIGALLFGVYAWVNPQALYDDDTIVVTDQQQALLAARFQRTWNRPPTETELAHLIDDFIVEEIFYREALAMGLDSDDTIIRRRLRQKMETMMVETGELLEPTDEQLQAYLDEHAEDFRGDPVLSFEQVFISTDLPAEEQAALIARVQADLAAGKPATGSAGLLPRQFTDTAGFDIDRRFGQGFAQRLASLPVGEWSEPIASGVGRHLIKVTAYQSAPTPQLADVRPRVKQEWQHARTEDMKAAILDRLKSDYAIVVEDHAG